MRARLDTLWKKPLILSDNVQPNSARLPPGGRGGLRCCLARLPWRLLTPGTPGLRPGCGQERALRRAPARPVCIWRLLGHAQLLRRLSSHALPACRDEEEPALLQWQGALAGQSDLGDGAHDGEVPWSPVDAGAARRSLRFSAKLTPHSQSNTKCLQFPEPAPYCCTARGPKNREDFNWNGTYKC